jgi:bifunctional non-homologous end joining protein LigD
MLQDHCVSDRLSTYRKKRDAAKTPEPVPSRPTRAERSRKPKRPMFVIQEHHARRLHWDLRLERDGVLVSWAVPKGLPTNRKTNHLAVQTEDHPMEYANFAGEIPQGEYGGGTVAIWDKGTYEPETWTDDEVKFVLHGDRAQGRYVLIRTKGQDWLLHLMEESADGSPASRRDRMPELVRPMLATLGSLPHAEDDEQYAYEMKWDGVRAVTYLRHADVRVMTRNDRDVTETYPELREVAPALATHDAILDGEIVALEDGRPSFELLQQRMHVVKPAQVRTLMGKVPVVYFLFDLLWLDGTDLTGLPYDERRAKLESLGIDRRSVQVPPAFQGNGPDALRVSRETGLEGVIAKLRRSRYEPGRRSQSWIKVKNLRTQEVVIGGWRAGEGRRHGGIGSLLLGIPDERGNLVYAGHVGTGFTQAMLDDLAARLNRLTRKTSPFSGQLPRADARDARWVTPNLVGEVVFGEWTKDGRMRQPAWRGLRSDKSPADVVRES